MAPLLHNRWKVALLAFHCSCNHIEYFQLEVKRCTQKVFATIEWKCSLKVPVGQCLSCILDRSFLHQFRSMVHLLKEVYLCLSRWIYLEHIVLNCSNWESSVDEALNRCLSFLSKRHSSLQPATSASDLVDSALDFLKVALSDLHQTPMARVASTPVQLPMHSNCLGCSSTWSQMIDLPSPGIYVSTILAQPFSAIEAAHLGPLPHTYLNAPAIHSPKLHLKDYRRYK